MIFFLDANICLDLLDTSRRNAASSVAWYLERKDDAANRFYFSADFISTIYYIMTEKKKISSQTVVDAIDALSEEIMPFYMTHNDFMCARASFNEGLMPDFEDLMILESAVRAGADIMVTHDRELLAMRQFKSISLVAAE